jgi:hypothetical protein
MGPILYFGTSGMSNVDALFFILWWDWYEFDKKKHVGTRYVKLVFFNPMGSVVHMVRSGASRARNGNTLFLCSGGLCVVSIKSVSGHVMLNFCVCIRWDLRV